jgi:hypothetical protein
MSGIQTEDKVDDKKANDLTEDLRKQTRKKVVRAHLRGAKEEEEEEEEDERKLNIVPKRNRQSRLYGPLLRTRSETDQLVHMN